MSSAENFLLVGLSHRTAPVSVREECAVPELELGARLAEALAAAGAQEGVLLSTCNRTELLLAISRPIESGEAGEGDKLVIELRRRFFATAERDSVYVHRGVHAVIHLFRVAAGLDSLVLGEGQILSQVKEAAAAARAAGALGKQMEQLLRQALQVGKRIRSETAVGEGSLSVARVGAQIARQVFGKLNDNSALLVGAGETATLVARHLADQGIASLSFVNRDPERAREAAAEFGARAGVSGGLEQLSEQIRRADLVVPCVDGAAGLIRKEHFRPRELKRRDQPLLVIDLSVPRAVEQDAARLDNLLYYDLDDLAKVVEHNRSERERATEGSDEILIAEVHKFLSLKTFAAFSPVIADLRRDFRAVREELLGTWRGEPLDANALAEELERRLLDAALRQLKAGARHAQPTESLSREYQRYKEGL